MLNKFAKYSIIYNINKTKDILKEVAYMDEKEYIVQTNNISKKYKTQLALNNVNMNIAKGDIYGFVGENGSGKTTIIRIITGIIFPTSGTFKLFGVDNKSKDRAKVPSITT